METIQQRDRVAEHSQGRQVLVMGKRLTRYPRNAAFLKALEMNDVVTRVELRESASHRAVIREVWRARNKQYDAIIFIQPATQFALAIALARIVTHATVVVDLFISLHSGFVEDRGLASRFSVKAFVYFGLDLLASHSAHMLLVDTDEHGEYFRRALHLGSKQILVVPVVIDTELIDRVVALPISAFDDISDVFRVFFVGTYIPLQGTEYIVRAAKILERHPQIRFVLLGGGQERPRVEALAKELGLTNLIFLPRAEYATYLGMLKSADLALGIFGATDKASRVVPNKVLEALAAGVPVLTGENVALQRDFKDQVHLRYCKMADPESLADAILQACREKGMDQGIHAHARAVIEKTYSVSSAAFLLRNLARSN